MTWVKLDDNFHDNPTNRALGPAGRDLFVAGLTYCAKGLTDGQIPKADLPLVLAQAQAKPALVKRLVDAGRWVDRGDHYEVDQYLVYQLSRARVEADRARERDKKRRQRQHTDRAPTGHYVPRGTPDGDTPGGIPQGGPSVPVPTRPPVGTSSAAATTSPDGRRRLLEDAAAIIGERAALRPGTRDPAATARAVARAVITDRHQHAYQAIADTPTLTAEQLAEHLEPTSPPAVVHTLPPSHVDERIAAIDPPPPQRIPDEIVEHGRAQVAALRRQLHPTPEDAA